MGGAGPIKSSSGSESALSSSSRACLEDLPPASNLRCSERSPVLLLFLRCLGGDRWRCLLGEAFGDLERDVRDVRLRRSAPRSSSSDEVLARLERSLLSSSSVPLRALYLSNDLLRFPSRPRCLRRAAAASSSRRASSAARAFWRSEGSPSSAAARFLFWAGLPPNSAAMLPSWRPRISSALGLYFRRFSSSAVACSFRRA